MSVIIEVKDLSKKYSIYHENRSSYDTLVETISHGARRCFDKLCHPFRDRSRVFKNEFEEFWALKDVNFTIAEGDRVGIIGRNGAGKSTLLKILCRITEPTKGRIVVRGKVASLLEVGTGFHPELTGRENIYLNGAILGMRHREIRQKFDEIVAFADVEKFLDTPVKRFSSGMYTRLGFAIAAHLDSDLLIVDEALAVGDAQFQEKCLNKLNDLSSNGRTVLFVSHNIGSVLTLCNKGIFLEKGCVKMIGPVDQCINAYSKNNRSQMMSWDGCEGDDHIRFYKVTLKIPEDRDFFFQNEKVEVCIEYEVFKTIQDLVLGISISDQRGHILARSHTWDDVDNFKSITIPGLAKAIFMLDASLLYEGEYNIKIDCFINHKKHIVSDQINLRFPLYAQKKNTRSTHDREKSGVFLGNQWTILMNKE